MKNHYDIGIIGAGASGMAAALEAAAARDGLRILVVEKNAEPGKKLRATGSGRCNISNEAAPGVQEALAFLRRQGIATRSYPNGLIYPYSESAADVTALLAARMAECNVELVLESSVREIKPRRTEASETGYQITIEQKGSKPTRVICERLIVAAGGKSGPTYGTTGDAYRMLTDLGHTLVRPIPVLTPIDCADDDCGPVSGTRAKASVTLYRNVQDEWKDVFTEEGEVQFTRFGLSGICVFNMTRHMRFDREEGIRIFEVGVDLCPDFDIRSYLFERRDNERKYAETAARSRQVTAATMLCSVLKDKLAAYVLRRSNIKGGKAIADLTDAELECIANNVHDLRYHPTGIHGWKEAQCTAGGISRDEIDVDTAESKLCKGLYITGELQDYDGPCGGYNLTHAWLTGMAAGRAAAQSL